MNIFFLQATSISETGNSSLNYLPIGIQLLFASAFVILVLGATNFLGPKRKTDEKLKNFESGIEGVGNARQPMSVKYFLVAILFVLFDVEVIFLYPWAVNFRDLGMDGLWKMVMFMGLLLVGFFYIIKKGALEWE